jgi:hypothetical protein
LQTKNLLNGVNGSTSEPNNNNTLLQNANPKATNSERNTLNGSKTPTSGTLQSHYRTLHNPHRKLDGGNVSSSSTGSNSNSAVSNSSSTGSNKNVHATYELSQEMIDKRVELLQRKYGPRAWAAVVLIQRFWRKRQMSQRFRNLALHAAQSIGSQSNGDSCKPNDSINKSINEPENMDLVDVASSEIILNEPTLPLTLNATSAHTITSASGLSGSGDSAVSGLSTLSALSQASTPGFIVSSGNVANISGALNHPINANKPILKRYSNASLHSNSSTGSSGSSMCRSPTLPSMVHSAQTIGSVNGGNTSGLFLGMIQGHPHLLYTSSGQFVTTNGNALLPSSVSIPNSASAQLLSSANHFQSTQSIAGQPSQVLSTLPATQANYVQMLQQSNGQLTHPNTLSIAASNSSLPHSQCSQMSLTSNCMQISPNRSSMCSNASLIGSAGRLPVAISASQLPHLQLAQYEILRKRQYRVGLNLFNKQPPERGIQYLIDNGFIDANLLSYANASAFAEMALSPLDANDSSSSGANFESNDGASADQQLGAAVAHFLLTRKGLSKQMIGEYLGNLQRPFNQIVLRHFVRQLDLAGLVIDVALRKYQTYFRFPGEAQKIERLVEVFAEKYFQCNFECGVHPALIGVGSETAMTKDEIFILAFAIIMLNTDLHVPNNKRRMTPQQWLKNLRGS